MASVENRRHPLMLASSLISMKDTLRPTQTIVRHSAILSHGWEEAAIESQQEEQVEIKVEVSSSSNKPRLQFLHSLKTAVNSWREHGAAIDTNPPPPLSDHSQQGDHTVTVFDSPEKECSDRLVPEYGWEEMHGFRGNRRWAAPFKIKHCDLLARPGYGSRLSHEYEDTPEVLSEKVKLLAELVKRSANCLVYTGAGISTSSGINDYATRNFNSDKDGRPKLYSPFEAQPTQAHRAVVAMYRARFVHYWVQQNHDGLPQKAGIGQEAINEIHGAWYDPSNPVVPMKGNLRSDLFTALLEWEQKTDLTLSLGTSMCGMNSDRVFTTVAHKGRSGEAIGGVIISLQQTQFDHLSCLRIYGKLDKVMTLLAEELELRIENSSYAPKICNSSIVTENCFLVPYDTSGVLLKKTKRCEPAHFSKLDLNIGQRVKLLDGPYSGDIGEVLGQNREGHYRIQFMHVLDHSNPVPQPRPFQTVLGSWWVEAAVKGRIAKLPLINA